MMNKILQELTKLLQQDATILGQRILTKLFVLEN